MSARVRRCPPPPGCRPGIDGFTLIELMIAMLLGILLMGALVSVFVGGLQTFRANDALARMQENGRLVLQAMRRDLRQTGYRGCRQTLQPELNTGATGSLDTGFVRNVLNSSAWDFTFANPVEGYRHDGTDWSNIPLRDGTPGANTLDPSSTTLLTPAPLNDSDILVVSFAGAPVQEVGAPGTAMSDPIALSTSAAGFAVSDIVMVSTCDAATIFQVSGISGLQLEHALASGSPGNRTLDIGGVFANGLVLHMNRNAYYVANSADTGRPTLFRNGEEFAEDVEQMRVRYGVDADVDRRIDNYLTADAVTDWNAVRAVRVQLLVSSGDETGLVEQPQTLQFDDGSTFTATDRRRYQLFTATVGIRNRLP